MSTTFAPLRITEPGVYEMNSSEYHNDPVEGGSLSSTGARTILRSPAHYRYWLENPKPATDEMMFGSAVHTLVLGAGNPIEIIKYDSYKTKAAQEAKAEALANGFIPMLPAKYAIAERMAEVVHAHPEAGPLLTGGRPELALVWRSNGIWRRALVDYLREDGAVDYKTTTSCELHELARTIFKYRYHQQDPYYRDGIRTLGLTQGEPKFRFVFQEKEAPYAIRVVELHDQDVALGEAENVRAMALYRDCRALDEWPSYPTHTAIVTLPNYAHNSSENPSCH